MKKITSIENKYIKKLSKLNNKKDIIKNKLFLIEGKNLINEAINLNLIKDLLIAEENLFPNFKGNKIYVNDKIIKKLSSNKTNPGVIGVCEYKENNFNLNSYEKIIVLESVNNPKNLGSIIRSALAFGFDAVVTTEESVFKYNPKTIKSSQGAIFKLPVFHIDDLNKLKDFYLYKFLISKDANDLENVKIDNTKKYALVFGNEANGLSNNMINFSKNSENIFIKIKNIDSLNLSIAASIAMFKLH